MRPIETLLLIANLLTFFVLALLSREVRWTGYAALTALTIAGSGAIEGADECSHSAEHQPS